MAPKRRKLTPTSARSWPALSTTQQHKPQPRPPRWRVCKRAPEWPPKRHRPRIKASGSASRLVLLDEAMTTLAAMKSAVAAAFAEKRRTDAARQAILSELRGDDPDHREILVELEVFDRARHDRNSSPFAPDLNEFHAEWQVFAAALLASAEASLGDAPVAPLPAYPRVEMPDPVIAAAQSAAAFPTTSIMR